MYKRIKAKSEILNEEERERKTGKVNGDDDWWLIIDEGINHKNKKPNILFLFNYDKKRNCPRGLS